MSSYQYDHHHHNHHQSFFENEEDLGTGSCTTDWNNGSKCGDDGGVIVEYLIPPPPPPPPSPNIKHDSLTIVPFQEKRNECEDEDEMEKIRDAAILLMSIAQIASREVSLFNTTNHTTYKKIQKEDSSSSSPFFHFKSPLQSIHKYSKTRSGLIFNRSSNNSNNNSSKIESIDKISHFHSTIEWSAFCLFAKSQQHQQPQEEEDTSTKIIPYHSSCKEDENTEQHKGAIVSTSSMNVFPDTSSSSAASSIPSKTLSSSKSQGKPDRGKEIIRKKFSWKHYPKLEAYLIANREEYLRYSTLNYSAQQKHYNNTLTQRLMELASENGYAFDENEFSFVTIRDRIRCYYKSYVQSMKKRGVVIGYAARKAGLLKRLDLERSVTTAPRIFNPSPP